MFVTIRHSKVLPALQKIKDDQRIDSIGQSKVDDVKFFDPAYEDLSNFNISVVSVEPPVFYRDVYIFVDRPNNYCKSSRRG